MDKKKQLEKWNKTLEKIADEEGVDFTSVRESVNSAIKKLRKFF